MCIAAREPGNEAMFILYMYNVHGDHVLKEEVKGLRQKRKPHHKET